MVSFVKKINEKSKELKEISKTYYDAASNLFKYIDENSKKNITNTDKKIVVPSMCCPFPVKKGQVLASTNTETKVKIAFAPCAGN